MRLSLGIVMACLAVSLSAQGTLQVGGSSYLGIGVADITAERAKALNLKEVRGAEVTSVAVDGPASKAGIKPGDFVEVVGDEQNAALVVTQENRRRKKRGGLEAHCGKENFG